MKPGPVISIPLLSAALAFVVPVGVPQAPAETLDPRTDSAAPSGQDDRRERTQEPVQYTEEDFARFREIARQHLDQLLLPQVEAADFERFSERLPFDGDRLEIAQALFDAYAEQLRAETERIHGVRPILTDRTDELTITWRRLDELFKELIDGVELLAAPGERAALHSAVRALRRDVVLQSFELYPGYTHFHIVGDKLDLVSFTTEWWAASVNESPTIEEEASPPILPAEVREALEEYESRLDRVLLQRLAPYRAGRLNFWQAAAVDDRRAMERAWAVDNSRWEAIDEINRRASGRIRGYLTENMSAELAERWRGDLLAAMSPYLFRDTMAHIWPWLAEQELEPGDEAAVRRAVEKYRRDLAEAESRIVRRTREERREPPALHIGRLPHGFGPTARAQEVGAARDFMNRRASIRHDLATALTNVFGRDHWTFFIHGTRRPPAE